MKPVLFQIPGIGWDVPGYGLALMVGFLLSIMWAARRAERSGANPDVVLNCGFIALLGGVVGARIMYVLHYWSDYASRGGPWQVAFAVIDVRKGGLEVYGGFVTVVALTLLYLWLGKHSIRWYLDIIAPSAALGMAIGRIGCFLNGCCFGAICDLPWTVRFPYGSYAEKRQWLDRTPHAGLPAELLYFAPNGMYQDGAAAGPLTRDLMWAPGNSKFAAAEKAWNEAAAQVEALKGKLQQTTDPAQHAKVQGEIAAAEQQKLMAGGEYGDILTQMARYGLSIAQLHSLAEQHPSLPVHPAQLYATLTLGLLALLLSAVYWRRTRDGQVICTMLLIEPITRMLLEIVRADNPHDVWLAWLPVPLTISQFLAICLSLVGLAGFFALRALPVRSPRAVLWEPPPELTPGKKKVKGAKAAG